MSAPLSLREEEIEITPEMVEAGSEALLAELGGGVSFFWNPRDLATSVYRAMERAHRSSRDQA